MDTYFTGLGRMVLEQWKRENFSLAKFPGIACAALEARPPAKHVDLTKFVREFLLNEEQPPQTQSGFGQPELVAYEHPRFYIQILFWLEGTTDIHQHEFSGAFHVMAGSSIHAQYEFETRRVVTPHFRVGDLRMKKIELQKAGDTVPIISGNGCIHSLFHLETPSVTVVLRTQNDPGTGPQYNYLPPHLAMDTVFSDTLTMRRKQLLEVLEQTQDPKFPGLVREMLEDLDFERGFFILQHCMGHLWSLGEWEGALKVFLKKHGKLAKGVAATLEESVRRDAIKQLRSHIEDTEHRFFLALLMNVGARADLLKLVAKRFPKVAPAVTIMRWAEELSEDSEHGAVILDATFPEALAVSSEEQFPLFMAALKHFLQGGKKVPKSLGALSAGQLNQLHAALFNSSLRVLLV